MSWSYCWYAANLCPCLSPSWDRWHYWWFEFKLFDCYQIRRMKLIPWDPKKWMKLNTNFSTGLAITILYICWYGCKCYSFGTSNVAWIHGFVISQTYMVLQVSTFNTVSSLKHLVGYCLVGGLSLIDEMRSPNLVIFMFRLEFVRS